MQIISLPAGSISLAENRKSPPILDVWLYTILARNMKSICENTIQGEKNETQNRTFGPYHPFHGSSSAGGDPYFQPQDDLIYHHDFRSPNDFHDHNAFDYYHVVHKHNAVVNHHVFHNHDTFIDDNVFHDHNAVRNGHDHYYKVADNSAGQIGG